MLMRLHKLYLFTEISTIEKNRIDLTTCKFMIILRAALKGLSPGVISKVG